MHMIPKTLIYWTIIKESIFWPLFSCNVANSHTIMHIHRPNALKNWWQQTTKSIFTDIKKVESTIPFIKKNLFLPGYYTPKPLKPVTFTLKQKILGSTIRIVLIHGSHTSTLTKFHTFSRPK